MATTRPTLTPAQSRIARSILADRLNALDDLTAESPEPLHQLTPLHDGVIALELQTGWISDRFDRLLTATETLAAIDFSDGRGLGAILVGAFDAVIEAARSVSELERFLASFTTNEQDSTLDLIRSSLAAATAWALMVIVTIIGEDEDEDSEEDALDRADGSAEGPDHLVAQVGADEELAESEEQAREGQALLDQLRRADLEMPEIGAALAVALGATTIASASAPTASAALAVGARQLRLVLPPEEVRPGYEGDYMTQALYLASQPNPLLLHRSAQLTRRLIDEAFACNSARTEQETGWFMANQAPRIQSSGAGIEQQLAAFYRDDEQLAILAAYRALAEGVARPFAQLVLRLGKIATGDEPGGWSRPPLLGALDDALRLSGIEVADCLRLGIAPGLRNAAAHEEAVVDQAGEIVLTTDVGEVKISPAEIERRFYLLRAALAGVDVAHNSIFYSREIPYQSARQTEASLSLVAQRLAAGRTGGRVLKLVLRPGLVRITVADVAERDQLYRLVEALAAFLDSSIERAEFVAEDRTLLAAFDSIHRRPGRNDPCPCGSGLKFKRCHGG